MLALLSTSLEPRSRGAFMVVTRFVANMGKLLAYNRSKRGSPNASR